MEEVKAIAQGALKDGTAMHVVEKELLGKLLQLGHAALKAMFQAVGHEDVGKTLTVPQYAKPLNRYPELSKRT